MEQGRFMFLRGSVIIALQKCKVFFPRGLAKWNATGNYSFLETLILSNTSFIQSTCHLPSGKKNVDLFIPEPSYLMETKSLRNGLFPMLLEIADRKALYGPWQKVSSRAMG